MRGHKCLCETTAAGTGSGLRPVLGEGFFLLISLEYYYIFLLQHQQFVPKNNLCHADRDIYEMKTYSYYIKP